VRLVAQLVAGNEQDRAGRAQVHESFGGGPVLSTLSYQEEPSRVKVHLGF
jgi:hypothetical protein